MNTGRFVSFLAVVLSAWTVMHIYVMARLITVPAIVAVVPRRVFLWAGLLLWVSYPLAHYLSHRNVALAGPIQLFGSVWLGVLFLMFVGLFVADIVTGFGFFLPRLVLGARLGAVGLALLLSILGVIQALMPPVVKKIEVHIPSLPADQEGLTLVQISDLHVGWLLGKPWLEKRIGEVEALHPDMIFVTGDVVDDRSNTMSWAETLRKLSARLGVFAVTGNHEFYAGLDRSLSLFEAAGFTVLRDSWIEVTPGLIIAGVDDLTAREQLGITGDPLAQALNDRPHGTTIFLSHTPWQVEQAADRGVDLMLSSHTHGGQIWPFLHLVRLQYPFVAGRYRVKDMTLIVSRGTGFWGPPMRLFHRSEILFITLRK